MTTRLRPLAIAALTVLLPAATAIAQKVSYDYDKTADFSGYKTFAFREGTKSDNPLVDDRVTKSIAASLAARGMTQTDSDPDLYIAPHLTYDTQKDITAYTTPWYGGYGWYWGGAWGVTDVWIHDITMGTLVIDMIDADSGRLVWRGVGEKEVDAHPKPHKLDKKVDKAVTKILRNFPPLTHPI